MNRVQMVEALMRTAGLTKANVNRFYDGLVELARKELLNRGEFVLPGLGVLRVRSRKAREGRNPQTGEKITISARKGVGFKPYGELRAALNPHLAKKKPEEQAPSPPAS